MKSIGVRELRQHAREYLRLVKAGEVIEVRERGRPVARLGPIPDDEDILSKLEAEGRITRPKRDLLGVKPAPPEPGLPTLSEVLARLREHER